jgi:transcriptional regulator with XRE-family HTH domain
MKDASSHKLSEIFGLQVRVARERQNLTQQAVADRLEDDHGVKMHATMLGRIESGERRVHIDEIPALALALNVPLAALLLPVSADGDFQASPTTRLTPYDAWQFLHSTARPQLGGATPYEGLWADARGALDALRAFADALDAWTLARSRVQAAKREGASGAAVARVEDDYADAVFDLADAIDAVEAIWEGLAGRHLPARAQEDLAAERARRWGMYEEAGYPTDPAAMRRPTPRRRPNDILTTRYGKGDEL